MILGYIYTATMIFADVIRYFVSFAIRLSYKVTNFFLLVLLPAACSLPYLVMRHRMR